MKHGNISIFIPHNGCPHKCSFCNQKNITGQSSQPGAADVQRILTQALDDLGERSKLAEIAFFGGSFTAFDRDYMFSLLGATEPFIDSFKGIRISTRPDCIDSEVLSVLKKFGVTSIELGAQSMDDTVLMANNRGHTAADVERASMMIKQNGFSLGLQMMTGLYKSDFERDIFTANEFIRLAPDTVRIYPTVIMKDTELARLYLEGEFNPYGLEESVKLCSRLITLFEDAKVKIIRLGLHYSDSLVENSLCGNYHPAFKELCENRIFFEKITSLAKKQNKSSFTAHINQKSLSKFLGQKKSNLKLFKEMGLDVRFEFDNTLSKYGVYLT